MFRKFTLAAVATLALSFSAPAFAQDQTKPEPKPEKEEVVMCPVMKEEVLDTASATFSDYKGKRYYFCCPGCKPKFDKNPEKYVKPETK